MHVPTAIAALCLLCFLTACERSSPPQSLAGTTASAATSPVTDPWLDDGRPQTGLPRMKLFLGPQELDTELALTDKAIQKGMMWRTNVAETSAMLFVFARPHQTAFWMKNVPINIDVAYLDPDGVILEVHRLEKWNTNAVGAAAGNVQFAVETAEGWFQRHGIGPGVVVRTDRGSLPETFFRSNKP